MQEEKKYESLSEYMDNISNSLFKFKKNEDTPEVTFRIKNFMVHLSLKKRNSLSDQLIFTGTKPNALLRLKKISFTKKLDIIIIMIF